RARFRGPAGEPAERCFLNAASFGLGAVAAAGVRRTRAPLPGSARYLLAAIPPLASGRGYGITLWVDGEARGSFEVTTVAVANGAYQGGGMKIAPEAVLDDGLAEVTLVERAGLAEVAAHLPILYSGAIHSHAKVRHWRGGRVRAAAENEVPLELDGEPVGTLPVEIEAIPRAVRCIFPSKKRHPLR
ncbi:MAG: hypothetical protein KGN36_20345, partial [Acidobacteriota bacterium]|nr:hypothetical protein [Acidobacteriota bacterium]